MPNRHSLYSFGYLSVLFFEFACLINEITSAILSVPETVQKELTGLIHKCMMIVYREKENGTLTEGIA